MNSQAITQPRGRVALIGGRVILPDHVAAGLAVIVEDAHIVGVAASDELGSDTERIDVGGRYVAPGLIDIHTHGALGHTFNEPTAKAFATITAANAARGVTSLLATIATDALTNLVACLAFTAEWMGRPRPGARILGAHLEGPYFSLAQRGAQDPAHIRNPDDGTPELLLAHHPVIRIMSCAPELPGALELTGRIAALDIVPAAGHSDAREEQVRAAMERGLRHVIHLWSGQSTEPQLSALAELQRQGLIRHLGLSNVTQAQVAQGRGIAEIVCVQNQYNLAHRDDDGLIDVLAGQGIAYVPFFPLGGFSPLQSSTLSDVAARLDATPMQVALAWLLRRAPNILLIPGTSSLDHLRENLVAARLSLSEAVLAELDAVGKIAHHQVVRVEA